MASALEQIASDRDAVLAQDRGQTVEYFAPGEEIEAGDGIAIATVVAYQDRDERAEQDGRAVHRMARALISLPLSDSVAAPALHGRILATGPDGNAERWSIEAVMPEASGGMVMTLRFLEMAVKAPREFLAHQ